MDIEFIFTKLQERSKHKQKTISIMRYAKLVKIFQEQKLDEDTYTESHHILPKAKDAFPELAKDKSNLINVTPRQHFILHWLLYRFFGKSQSYAFIAMLNKGAGANAKAGRFQYKISSRAYEIIKNKNRKHSSESRKGLASYRDAEGGIHTVSNKDPRVLSGELESLTKGRSGGTRSEEWKEKHSVILKKRFKNPDKKIAIYLLGEKRVIKLHSDDFQTCIDEGWSTKCTPEYRTAISLITNANMSKEARTKAGKGISSALKGRKRTIKKTKEQIISHGLLRRTNEDPDFYKIWVYDSDYNLSFVDRLTEYDETIHSKLFKKREVRVFEKSTGGMKFINKNFNMDFLPDWLTVHIPTVKRVVFDKTTREIYFALGVDIRKNSLVIYAPNGDRIKLRSNCGAGLYVTKQFIDEYGMPINCDFYVKND